MPNTLRLGSQGPDVVTWQKVLGIKADGDFGKETDKATRAWQSAHTLPPDGVVGKDTWAAAGVVPVLVPLLGKVERAPYGARILDSLGLSQGGTRTDIQALKNSPRPIDGVALYMGASRSLCEAVIDEGLGLFFVTKAGAYANGPLDEIGYLRSIGCPPAVHAAVDVEGLPAFDAGKKDPVAFEKLLKDWASGIRQAGWLPMRYVGAPQPSLGTEMDVEGFDAFWWGQGKPVGRDGLIAYPKRGFVLKQGWHNETKVMGYRWPGTNLLVDANAAEVDHYGNSLSWVVKA